MEKKYGIFSKASATHLAHTITHSPLHSPKLSFVKTILSKKDMCPLCKEHVNTPSHKMTCFDAVLFKKVQKIDFKSVPKCPLCSIEWTQNYSVCSTVKHLKKCAEKLGLAHETVLSTLSALKTLHDDPFTQKSKKRRIKNNC